MVVGAAGCDATALATIAGETPGIEGAVGTIGATPAGEGIAEETAETGA
jgi:hypothetical protein